MRSERAHPIVADSASRRDARPQQRVSLRVMAQRRRHVLRSVLIVIVVTGLMVVLSLANRDWQDVRRCRENLDYAVAEFRKTIDRRVLPRTLPQRPDSRTDATFHYHYQPFSTVLDRARGTVGVCCCARRHNLFASENGRHVVTYDGEEFEVRWMTEREFAARGEALGLRVIGGP